MGKARAGTGAFLATFARGVVSAFETGVAGGDTHLAAIGPAADLADRAQLTQATRQVVARRREAPGGQGDRQDEGPAHTR